MTSASKATDAIVDIIPIAVTMGVAKQAMNLSKIKKKKGKKSIYFWEWLRKKVRQ